MCELKQVPQIIKTNAIDLFSRLYNQPSRFIILYGSRFCVAGIKRECSAISIIS
jgi:hypothetical protein